MQKRNSITYAPWATGIFLLTVAFFVFPTSLSAKGNFARITIQTPDSEQKFVLTDAAYLGFFAFSDFAEDTREAPPVVGPGYTITRWSQSDNGESFQPFDQLRWYDPTTANAQGRGWIFYEGLLNGSSEYDGKWFMSTRNGDALLQEVLVTFPIASPSIVSATVDLMATPEVNEMAAQTEALPRPDPIFEMETADALLSPDGKWLAEIRWNRTEQTYPTVEVRISAQDGTERWTPIREARAVGLAAMIPQFVQWSTDSQRLYVSKAVSANGCPSFLRYNGLQQIDVTTHEVTEYFTNSITLAISPNKRWVAYVSGEPSDGHPDRLFLLDRQRDETQIIPFVLPTPDAQFDDAQLGSIVWEPSSSAFALAVVDNLCSLHPQTMTVRVDVPALDTAILVNTDEVSVQPGEWLTDGDNITLVDQEGHHYNLSMPGTELTRLPPREVYVNHLTGWEPATALHGITFQPSVKLYDPQPVAHSIPEHICPPYDVKRWVDHNCAEAIETFHRTQGAPGIVRDGDRLTIATPQGNVVFTNQIPEDSLQIELYHYLNYIPQLHKYLVSLHGYETSRYLLVNADTGERTPIPAIPMVNESGSRFAIPFTPSESSEVTIQLWRVNSKTSPMIAPEWLITIPYAGGAYGKVSANWIGENQFSMRFTPYNHQLSDYIVITIEPADVDIQINGESANRPPVRFGGQHDRNDPIRAVDRLTVGKTLYDDRNYSFTQVPADLEGQPYLLFDNSNMHETVPDYVTFHLYRPSTLYVAIDEQACALPGWLADWTPVDITIETNDIGMKLYQRAFPEGDVTLGGNEAPPAACIRSHYLLFVRKSERDLP